ncbi:MAG: DUF4250 domain-containing protein [Candidatus Merdivicinus sp.]
MSVPQDPVILLSYLNTQLRDFYRDLDDACKALNLDREAVVSKLETIGYNYDPVRNQFR